ncbi:MAG: czcR [Schlesneria sp.]|jgi:two-component system OmpR family response regulator|nr:czcR [Schlesneria sp.]
MIAEGPKDMRVLIVEDEPDLQRVVWTCLQEEGYVVDAASDGEEGLYKAANWDYDVIVLDVMLPKLDGWQVLARLRKLKATPVLMLTARDTVHDRVKGLDAGADDYLVKPFQLAELLARLRALIRRAAGQSQPVIEIGDTHIDTVSRTVTRIGSLIPLTAMEYSLVELLALHRGKLVTRSMIYDKLYDEDDDTLSNLVDVHVSNIRRKLGHEFITTRRGQGYMIND